MPKKRDGRETRTAVLSPEKKLQKMEYVRKDFEFIQNCYSASRHKDMAQLDLNVDGTRAMTLCPELPQHALGEGAQGHVLLVPHRLQERSSRHGMLAFW